MSFAVFRLVLVTCLWPAVLVELRGGTLPPPADDLYVATRWQTKEGLPQNSVSTIVQTPDGYLWFGTFNGLVRFDGVRFTIYAVGNTPELQSDFINILRTGPDGTLWIGTGGGGLVRWRDGRFTRIGAAEGVDASDVLFLALGPDGSLWVGSAEDVYHFEGGKFVKLPRLGIEKDPIIGLARDRHGHVWVGTAKGLRKVWDSRLGTTQVSDEAFVTAASGSERRPAFLDLKEGMLRLQDGQPADGTELQGWPDGFMAIDGERVWSISSHLVSPGRLRVSREGQTWEFRSHPYLTESDVIHLYPDRDGNLWAGLDGGGLVRLRPKQVTTISVLQGLPSNNTVTIAQDRSGRFWVGRLGGKRGLSWLMPPDFTVWPEVEIAPRLLVSSCYAARDGAVWIGTADQGLYRWSDGNFEHRPAGPASENQEIGSMVRVLFEDRSGGLWVGTDGRGAERFQAGSVKRYGVAEGLSHNRVTAIAEDRSGTIWIGTADGLNRLERGGGLRRYSRSDGLGADIIHCVFVDRQEGLWVGTAGGGLSRLEGERFRTMTEQEGLVNNVVAQILEDDAGDLWIGTNRGLGRLKREDIEAYWNGKTRVIHCLSFGDNEGMISEECGGGFQPASLKDGQGRLWFCTVGGLVMIDPARVRRSSASPPVHIEEVWLDGVQSPRPGDPAMASPISVPPSSRVLEIRFTGIHFSNPERLLFRYMLEDYDRDWVEAGPRRSAFYTRLPPGQYRFRVSAGHGQGLWSETEATVALRVQPAWWERTWFHAVVALNAVGLVGGAYFFQVSRFKTEQARKAEFSRRLIESQETERQRISRELHDSLGLSFAVIKNNAQLALAQSKGSAVLEGQIREICQISSDAVEEVRQIAHALRPTQLDRLGLTRSIEVLAEQMARSGDLQLNLSIDRLDDLLTPSDQIHLLRVVQESLGNVLKHARASAIEISICRESSFLRLMIADDGRGFDLNAVRDPRSPSGLGLMAIRERIEILKGVLEIDAVSGQGTRLTARIPHTGSSLEV